jgi:hypothetical protein
LTQQETLRFSVAFIRDGNEIAHSNIVTGKIRAGIPDNHVGPPTQPHEVSHKRYWGVSIEESLTDEEIKELSSEFSSTRVQSRIFDCTGGRFFYIAYPEGWGLATFLVNNFPVTSNVLVTREFISESGDPVSYHIYRIANTLNGAAVPVEVN